MKKEILLHLLIVVLIISIGILTNFPDILHQSIRPQLSPGEFMAHQRMYPYGSIKQEAYFDGYKQVAEVNKTSKLENYTWELAGPTNIGGRITDIAIHPDSPETIYLGAASGGVWKSVDNGTNWEYKFNGVNLISIGDIAIDPNNENIIYAGTGEANASSYSFMGDGIYKSTNAGEDWEHMGLEFSAYIGRIVVDYDNSERLFAAACGNLFTPDPERGVYRSEDGGTNWEKILFINDSVSAIDIIQHPENPDILFAGMWERMRGLTYRHSFGEGTGLWKTDDGGDNWFELTNGLPSGDAGRLGLAIAASNPEVMYAYYDMPGYEVNVYKSTNGGTSWAQTNDGELDGNNSSFGWYFGQIRVHPEDENMLFVMGVQMYRSTNGGNSWSEIGGWDIHVDHHAMYFDTENDRIVQGNDGGLYTSSNNGSDWSKINNLPFTQFYAIDVDYQNPDRIIGGTQDNNTIITYNGSVDDWDAILGGDGMYCLIDYTNSNVLYAESQWGNLYKSTNGGNDMDYISWQWEDDRVNWSAPLAMDPINPQTLYFGTYRIWKSTNSGNSWTDVSGDITKGIDQYFHTVTTIAIHPVNQSIVIAGTGDGLIHVSTNAGSSWTNITNGIPDRWVTQVAGDPFDENTIYATISGFRWDEALAHVFKSTDLGQTWESISGNLPEIPMNAIVLDPDHEGHIFVGSDAGVFYTKDGGQSWSGLNEGIYNVPVMAMKIHNPSRRLVIGTYGVSAYRLDLDDLITGVNKQNDLTVEFTIYPNPFKESINILGPTELVEEFILFDVNGRQIIWADKIKLKNLTDLPAGIYYLDLLDQQGKTISKEKVIKL